MSQCFEAMGQSLSLLIFLACSLMFGASEREDSIVFCALLCSASDVTEHGTCKRQMYFKWLLYLRTPPEFCCIGVMCTLIMQRDPCTVPALELGVSSLTPPGVTEVQSVAEIPEVKWNLSSLSAFRSTWIPKLMFFLLSQFYFQMSKATVFLYTFWKTMSLSWIGLQTTNLYWF